MASTSPLSSEVIRQRLTQVFQKIFDAPSLALRDDLTASDVPAWDSLTHIDLIVAVEKAFKVKLTTSEITGLKNVGDLIKVLERKLVQQ